MKLPFRTSVLLFLWMVAAFVVAQESDEWTLTATDRAHYAGPTVANGHLGLVVGRQPFTIDHVWQNGIYDREATFEGVTTAVEGPAFLNLSVRIDGRALTDADVANWRQRLNLRHAVCTTEFDALDCHFVCHTAALRHLPYVAATWVELTPKRALRLDVVNRPQSAGGLCEVACEARTLTGADRPVALVQMTGRTPGRRYEWGTAATLICAAASPGSPQVAATSDTAACVSLKADLTAGATLRFVLVGALCTQRDFSAPANEAARLVATVACDDFEDVLARHRAEWDALWQADIVVEGDRESQLAIRSALYHLYAFVRADNRQSPSPMGLSSNGYNRHVFWDSEIWMFPPLLLLQPALAKSMLDYRTDRLAVARQRARAYGWDGAMFPWESDDSGDEACPLFALTGPLEHHITSDVGLAAWQYFCLSRDTLWLRREGWPLIESAARFVASRASLNADGSYSIRHVVGADEYAQNIDDDAYTNGAARQCLAEAIRAAEVLGESVPAEWGRMAQGLRIHRFADGTVREHAAYAGQLTKQADVWLLTYPLSVVTDEPTVRRNLDYYGRHLDPKGPAMSHNIASILCSRMGDGAKAWEHFLLSFKPHECPPFGLLSETPGGGNPYFATAAGGMLQAVLMGFGGLQLTEQGIRQTRPCLPPTWKSLTLKGIGPQRTDFHVDASR